VTPHITPFANAHEGRLEQKEGDTGFTLLPPGGGASGIDGVNKETRTTRKGERGLPRRVRQQKKETTRTRRKTVEKVLGSSLLAPSSTVVPTTISAAAATTCPPSSPSRIQMRTRRSSRSALAAVPPNCNASADSKKKEDAPDSEFAKSVKRTQRTRKSTSNKNQGKAGKDRNSGKSKSSTSLSRQFEVEMARQYREADQAKLLEEDAINMLPPVVIGCDEAGRGPLAGPVVAAACMIPIDEVNEEEIQGVNDSKKLSEEQREALFKVLTEHSKIKYAVSIIGPRKIEEINILHAAMLGMDEACQELFRTELLPKGVSPDLVLIDGPRLPKKLSKLNSEGYNPRTYYLDGDEENKPKSEPTSKRTYVVPVVKGDSKSFSIAAASIIAKVTRDRIMLQMDHKWPQYEFARHKGYPTKDHVSAISKHGPCEIHRMTFAPLKHWYPDGLIRNTSPNSRGHETGEEDQKSNTIESDDASNEPGESEPKLLKSRTRSRNRKRAHGNNRGKQGTRVKAAHKNDGNGKKVRRSSRLAHRNLA